MTVTAEQMVPDEVAPADSDVAVVIWRRERKSLVVYLTCYGHCNYHCGLSNPPGGSRILATFEKAWKWYVDEKDELPTMEEQDLVVHRMYRSGDGV